MNDDPLICTVKRIAAFLGLTERTVHLRRRELVDGGYMFRCKLRPGHKAVWVAWRSKLQAYVEDRARDGKWI